MTGRRLGTTRSQQLDQACENCHKHCWYPHQFDTHPEGLPPGEGASKDHEFSDRAQRRRDAEVHRQATGLLRPEEVIRKGLRMKIEN